MKFQLKKRIKGESVYFYDSNTQDIVYSTGNHFTAVIKGKKYSFSIDLNLYLKPFLPFRLARRALRLDMANVVLNYERTGLIVIYQGTLYFFDFAKSKLFATGCLKNCRNVLYCGVAVTKKGIYVGEYGGNTERKSVPVWCSRDGGINWEVVYEFPEGKIKHIHGIYQDPFSDQLFIPTGDFEGECFLVSADENFNSVRYTGDGKQQWRMVSLLFEPDKILWAMDSQLETSYLIAYDRKTGLLSRLKAFPGPVWYLKQLEDGFSVLQTTVEIGAGVKSNKGKIYASPNHRIWEEVASFYKDKMPMRYWKFGVLSFADGPQFLHDFVVFGEGLRSIDGKAFIASITDSVEQ